MDYLSRTPIVMVKDTHWTGKGEVDHKNEYEAQNSDALHFNNVSGGGNDKQLTALMEYYHLNEVVNEKVIE